MQIKEVFSPPQIIGVQKLANQIWNECYPAIITQEQVDYMLETLQTAKAILQQIQEGYIYFLLIEDEKNIGYMSMKEMQNSLFLSKLYIHKDARQQGRAKGAILFLKDYAKKAGLSSIFLTVNKHNEIAIKTYENFSFIRTGSLIQNIGNGFIMDDFRYELPLK
jgi:diamine N-acetyltransferase